MKIFYVFFETDGDLGRYRQSFGFCSAIARTAWVTEELRLLRLRPEDGLSDLEYWESSDGSWGHIRVIG